WRAWLTLDWSRKGRSFNWTFAPQINLTVQGNVHEPQRLADELLPYLQRMLVDFADERQRRSLYDPAMV
ncbi:hypothetical protein ACLBVR_31095, partial [Pseudomonas aeruginosa]|uniref:hypothetical protein n=1 Tax=Pseudomonas aeruginosa TaxID=287 RepID=UPI003968F2FD